MKRGPGRPFKPGKSGNPSGRPKSAKEFEALARARSPQALERLLEIAKGRGMPAVKACEILLDRAWGKPTVTVAGGKGGPLDTRFRGAARAALEQAVTEAERGAVFGRVLSVEADDEDDEPGRDVIETEGAS